MNNAADRLVRKVGDEMRDEETMTEIGEKCKVPRETGKEAKILIFPWNERSSGKLQSLI